LNGDTLGDGANLSASFSESDEAAEECECSESIYSK